MKEIIKIGNAQGFWGDQAGAAAELLSKQPDLDFLTMDYLAEVSLSLLAMQKERAPTLGYARDFVEELRRIIPYWENGSRVKVVVNAGGLNPIGCANACLDVLRGSRCLPKKIGVVSGDDVLSVVQEGGGFPNLDTGQLIDAVRPSLVSANAYLGSAPIIEALRKGADIVITGRVADPSLTAACAAWHFEWGLDDYDKLAQATIAGHLIECGTQVTGGISTNWLCVPDPGNMGYPVVEIRSDGEFVITKPEGTGGVVNEQTVKEQLLYEIGDPDHYLSPDVEVSFLQLQMTEDAPNRMRISGGIGRPPPSAYKVSATYRDGYMAEGTVALFGRQLYAKAQKCGQAVQERVKRAGFELEKFHIECIGTGDVVPGVIPRPSERELREGVLRLSAKDSRKEAVDCFAKSIAPLVTSGSQGVTGYFRSRPKTQQVFGFWPCVVPVLSVHPIIEMMEVS
jgi:hypothetical protein